MSKAILGIYGNNHVRWVGNGFPVRTLFSYDSLRQHVSPFLLLNYAGPHYFGPTAVRRGVGQRPHRGVERITIVYEGQLEYKDSFGNLGLSEPGDVQWMTAGRGIIHEEFHGPSLRRAGGSLRVVELWVDLPEKDKMALGSYQTLLSSNIPILDLPRSAGKARVIAGEFRGLEGPACTFTPINIWDLRLCRGADVVLDIPEGHTAMLVVLTGILTVSGEQSVNEAEMALLSREGVGVQIQPSGDATVLVLSGQPIDESSDGDSHLGRPPHPQLEGGP